MHHTEELSRFMDTIITKLIIPKEGTMAALVMVVSLIINEFMLVAGSFNINESEKIAIIFNTI